MKKAIVKIVLSAAILMFANAGFSASTPKANIDQIPIPPCNFSWCAN